MALDDGPARRRHRLAVSLSVLVACSAPPPAAEPIDDAAASEAQTAAGVPDTLAERPPPGSGFVVWESDRGGDWRIWIRDLDGSPERRLSPDEGDRQHCCAHVAPGGERVAYLSLARGQERYPESGASGRLHTIGVDGSAERRIVDEARTYFEHRAVVWRSPDELIFIDGGGDTRLLDVESGASRPLAEVGAERHGWLVNATLTHATTGRPSFSPYDAERRRISERSLLGGCQPYFSHDGRWGFWTAAAGGPIRALDLASGATHEILRKSDSRLPPDRGYLYFPMLSHDGRLFAWGASNDEHDHFESNYDVFVAAADPDTLQLIGRPWQVTADPATDLFPDVYSASLALTDTRDRAQRPTAMPETRIEIAPPSWPSDPRGLVFLWQSDGVDQVEDPVTGERRTCLLSPEGRAWRDRNFAMELAGGAFVAREETMLAVLHGCRRTNELTLEATLTPHRRAGGGMARVVAFSSGERSRNLTLGQVGDSLVFRLRTATTGQNADRPQLELGRIPIGRPTHVLVSYAAGRLVAYLDGREVLASDALQEGFFHWKARPLVFGNEWQADHPWYGTLEGVAIYDRALGPEEASENHRRYAELLAEVPPVPRARLRVELVQRSRIPTLQEISPYREALAVFEYELEEILEGELPEPASPGSRLRVAHRVLVDGETLPVSGRPASRSYELTVEPFVDHLELESLYLSDTLPQRSGPLFFSSQISSSQISSSQISSSQISSSRTEP